MICASCDFAILPGEKRRRVDKFSDSVSDLARYPRSVRGFSGDGSRPEMGEGLLDM